jgi:ATP-binding cassette subfamily F protein uup
LALRNGITASDAVSATPSRGVDSRSAKREIKGIERRIARIDAAEKRLHEQLATHATDHKRVAALDEELRALTVERDALETQWLELTEAQSAAGW